MIVLYVCVVYALQKLSIFSFVVAQFPISLCEVDFLFLNYTRIHYDYKTQSILRGCWSVMG